jgi:hypothetical protein
MAVTAWNVVACHGNMLLPWPAWGRTDMIRPCRCYGVPDLLQVPNPILLRMGPQTLKVPHGTVLVLTLRFARSSSRRGPWIEVSLRWPLKFPLERCSRWQNPRKWHNTLSQNTHSEGRCHHTQHNANTHAHFCRTALQHLHHVQFGVCNITVTH